MPSFMELNILQLPVYVIINLGLEDECLVTNCAYLAVPEN